MRPATARDRVPDLRAVQVRLTRGAAEHRRWDRLVAAHHYLPFHGLFGRALRHVATLDGTWLALLGWQAGALKIGVRDRWIGWSPQQRLRRLHLIAHNARFVILPTGQGRKNLASRVLGLCLRRLSADMRAVHGYPALLAESFVNPRLFAGTCYRAANWRALGRTGGYARRPGPQPRWHYHGQPKEVFVYEIQPDARVALAREADDPAWQPPPRGQPPPAAQLRSLVEFLAAVADPRCARGKRYPLATVLALAVAARLAGFRGVTAFAQFAALLDQEQLRAIGCFFSPSRQCYTSPSITTFHTILSKLPPDSFDECLQAWADQLQQEHEEQERKRKEEERKARNAQRKPSRGVDEISAVAIDGKEICNASKQRGSGNRARMVAAVEQDSGMVLGQEAVAPDSNEIPAVRALIGRLDLAGRVVTLDAQHAQQETARLLVDERQAAYIAIIKDNQETIHDDLQAMDFSACPTAATRDKGHGRIDDRRYWFKEITDPGWDGYADLHGRTVAIRIERTRHVVKTGKTTVTVSYALTSLPPERVTPQQLAAMLRNHWHIENRLHYVRDFTYDEDRCRVYVRDLPRNLAALTNTAISIVRCQTEFPYVPEANRHFAARAQEALDLICKPPVV